MNDTIMQKIEALIRQESQWFSVMANTAALLYEALPDVCWVGFYILRKAREDCEPELLLGPFQGRPAPVTVAAGRGVCGSAAVADRTVIEPVEPATQDVRAAQVSQAQAVREERALSDSSFSEGAVCSVIAVPLHSSAGEVIGVLHLQSSRADRFDDALVSLLQRVALDVEVGISGLEQKGYSDYRLALRSLREPVTSPKVVYQGEPGAYSEAAALDFFGREAQITGLRAFEDTFKALKSGSADYAVLPIENSSTGVIRQVYDLLAQYECYMIGETTVRVQHSFMVLPGTRLEEIDTVYSHEQGLFQCEAFLRQHPEWKQIPQEDTAGSARIIAELKNPTKAAICSPRAAEIYGLEILFEAVNSDSQNTTRFVVISPAMEIRDRSDKICISFMTPHKPGALHEVLTIFTVRGLNLMRLESRPIPEHNWEYMFFVEFTGNLTSPGMDDVIRELANTTENLRVYGNFHSNL